MSKTALICTARYSDNLGDGVIGDCFEYLITRCDPTVLFSHIDISGRLNYASTTSKSSYSFKDIFNSIPTTLRPIATRLAWPIIFKPKMSQAVREIKIKDDKALIFGGGQLLSDMSLNFPIKIAFLADWARKNNLPVALNSIGVSKHWSSTGRRFITHSLRDCELRYVSVRDPESQSNFHHNFPWFKGQVHITSDPAIWVAEAFQITATRNIDRQFIGLGISDPSELRSYATSKNGFTRSQLVQFWSGLAMSLINQGFRVKLFTNGAREDELFADKVAEHIPLHFREKIYRSDRMRSPRQLVELISKFDLIVSHRLHANIIAFGCDVPAIALMWDEKVSSFKKLADQSDSCFENLTPIETLVEYATKLLHTPHNSKNLRSLMQDRSIESTRQLLSSLK